MTTQDYDDRDAEFTGILAQPLKPGEDPSLKLPILYEALGVEGAEAAVLALARMIKPLKGFRPSAPPQRKRKTPGRPNLLTMRRDVMDATDHLRLPDFIVADAEERLIGRMETLLAAAREHGRPMKVLDAAFRAIEEEEVEGQVNHFHLDGSIPREKREAFACSVASLFTHRAKRREKHAAVQEALRDRTEREMRAWFKPRWPQILEEMTDRVSEEAVERVAAGERAEDVLADVEKRALEVANEIVQRRWPI